MEAGLESDRSTTPRARVLAVSSGKGGVGKTNISTNLAIALSRRGKRVCVFDADTSLANVNILLNVTPRLSLEHFLDGSHSISEVLLEAPGDISIVPAASGIARFADLQLPQQKLLIRALSELESRFDYLIIDTAAGIGTTVLRFLQAVEHCLLVVAPEPTSLTDAFALMKVLRRQPHQPRLHILGNMVDSYPGSIDLYKRLSAAATRYLQLELSYFGYVPRDDAVLRSVRQQRPVVLAWPGSPAGQRFFSLADSLDSLFSSGAEQQAFSHFWKSLLEKSARSDEADVATGAPDGRDPRLPASYFRSEAGDTDGSAPGAETAQRRQHDRASIIGLQQAMASLIRSRALPARSMAALLHSLLRLTLRNYPDMDLPDLVRRCTEAEAGTAPSRGGTGDGGGSPDADAGREQRNFLPDDSETVE